MNLFHPIALALLALSFSGKPAPAPVAPVKTDTSANQFFLSPKTEDQEFIPWTPQSRLSWEDFQCSPKRGTDAVASTSTSLGIAYQVTDGQLTYHITCNFSKAKSWGLMKTDYILAHEQGHFDITEIFARKLHESLQNYTFNKKSFRRDINDIYQAIVQQKEEYQKMYDEESDHSRNRNLQYEWLERIQTLLRETEAYAEYP